MSWAASRACCWDAPPTATVCPVWKTEFTVPVSSERDTMAGNTSGLAWPPDATAMATMGIGCPNDCAHEITSVSTEQLYRILHYVMWRSTNECSDDIVNLHTIFVSRSQRFRCKIAWHVLFLYGGVLI